MYLIIKITAVNSIEISVDNNKTEPQGDSVSSFLRAGN
ncbi:hypothetical protein BH695_3263 [Microcystis aeruginosa PCC 7806SL]|uniref:Orphan protein n=1 Tax=Microcystis aeruginosa PCC 7806SL TaxID=1903187 RepID=A0AB33BRD4_MICA7|nr:hypothetical protein BH695_3263 [Microcystis aeruginosa PCC 7806SL]